MLGNAVYVLVMALMGKHALLKAVLNLHWEHMFRQCTSNYVWALGTQALAVLILYTEWEHMFRQCYLCIRNGNTCLGSV